MNEATYTAEEAIAQFVTHGLASSRLYRRVKEGVITKYLPTGRQRGAIYSKADVDRVCALEGKKQGPAFIEGNVVSVVTSSTVSPVEDVLVRPLAEGDIGAVYHLQFEQVGFDNAIQPMSMRKWVQDGLPIFWVAQDPQNSSSIWAAIGVVPLDEELIIGFLRGEFMLQEIAMTDVRSYQRGRSYACYVVAAADPAHPDALIRLMEYLLSYWCDQYPDVMVRSLYASVPMPIGIEETPLLRMLHMFSFWRLRDISTNMGVWTLPLDEYNPTPTIKQYQKCIEEKKNMLVLEKRSLITDGNSDSAFSAPLQYRVVKTREDVAALVQIGAEIFVPPGVQPSISNEYQVDVWYSWFMKNPEIFHVVTVDEDIVGYISLIPLRQDKIDAVMRGAHPTTITPDDVLMFESNKPLNVYAHLWGTTTRLTEQQKNLAGAKMIRGMRRMFVDDFARRGIDIRFIYTRSNKEDGIGIAEHLGMKDIEVPGVTDALDLHDRKRVFCVDTATSTNSFLAAYRQALEGYHVAHLEQEVNS